MSAFDSYHVNMASESLVYKEDLTNIFQRSNSGFEEWGRIISKTPFTKKLSQVLEPLHYTLSEMMHYALGNYINNSRDLTDKFGLYFEEVIKPDTDDMNLLYHNKAILADYIRLNSLYLKVHGILVRFKNIPSDKIDDILTIAEDKLSASRNFSDLSPSDLGINSI